MAALSPAHTGTKGLILPPLFFAQDPRARKRPLKPQCLHSVAFPFCKYGFKNEKMPVMSTSVSFFADHLIGFQSMLSNVIIKKCCMLGIAVHCRECRGNAASYEAGW